MATAATLGVLALLHVVQIWQILALSFCTGLAQAFGGPAYQSLIPSLVDKKDLPNAVALNSIQFNIARRARSARLQRHAGHLRVLGDRRAEGPWRSAS